MNKIMKMSIVFLLLIVVLSGIFFYLLMRQNHNLQKLESEYESLQQRLASLEIQPQTGQDDEKMKLATQLANANTKLINAGFGKFERELRDSNYKWLWGWTTFFVAIVAIVVTVTGVAFWVVVKSMIANRVEENLKGFQESVEQVKIQQERIRIIERDYAAQMLEAPDEISEGGEYIYSDTVMSLSKQTVLDVIYHKTYPIHVRIRAAEIFKKRNPVQSLPVLLEMVNSFLDTDIYKDEDIDTIWHLRDLVPLFKDIHNDKTYRGLSKLLGRVVKLKEDTDLKKAYLNWILFSLAYVGDALNTESAISRMREVLPNLLISNEDSHNLENLVNYFDKFDEHEGIKDILTNGLTDGMPDVEKQCLELLQEHDPDFVRDWKDKKETTNPESEGTS